MNIKEMVAERIQTARKSAELSQSDLARACGYSRGRLSNWENASRMPGAQDIHKMAKVLKVSPAWLFCVTDNITEYETYQGQILILPIIEDAAAQASSMLKSLSNSENRTLLIKQLNVISVINSTNTNYHENMFAFRVADSSMQPTFLNNDLLIIDPNKKPTPSDYVLATIDNKVMIRKFRKPNSDEVELISLNEDWPNLNLDANETGQYIIGTVVEMRRVI